VEEGSIHSYVVVIGKSPVGWFGCCSLQPDRHTFLFHSYYKNSRFFEISQV